MPILITALGLLGLTVDFLFFIAFVALLGYYLYNLEKRVENMEQHSNGSPPKKPDKN